MNSASIPGQLNEVERKIIRSHVRSLESANILVEVGTWKGGGSTLSILEELKDRNSGHLLGIEAAPEIYQEMTANLQTALPDALQWFTPVFGFSQKVLPALLGGQLANQEIDLVFLDGGDNPREQIDEFNMLAPRIRTGGVLMSHDANFRKGKWLVPYVRALDNWQCQLHEVSEEGLFEARKTAAEPSKGSLQRARNILFKKRLQPLELLSAVLPSSLCALAMSCLPSIWQRRVAGGYNKKQP
jgi:predicted O-methyltransferase YrrM